MIKKIIYSIALLACINSCKYYTLPVKDFANQLSKLQVIKERKMSITAGKHKTVKFENYYVNNLNYLYCFDENGKGDSVYLRGAVVKYYTKNGNSGYSLLMNEIVRGHYFISIEDSNLTVRSRCTYCKIHVDSVIKVKIKN